MAKESKISVTHFLNTNLKPHIDGKIKKYPLYVRVRFENKKTEFRSKASSFYYEGDIDALVSQMQRSDFLYFSEQELAQADYRLLNEKKAVFDIVSLFKDRGKVNIIDLDPVPLIDACLVGIDEILDSELKILLKDKLLKSDKYISVLRSIDWTNPFHTIYKALEVVSGGSIFFEKIVSKFTELNHTYISLRILMSHQKRQLRLYELAYEPTKEAIASGLQFEVTDKSLKQILTILDQAYHREIERLFSRR